VSELNNGESLSQPFR